MSPMPMSSDSPSTPAKLTCRLFGSRCSSDPLTTTPSSCDRQARRAAGRAAAPSRGAFLRHLALADRARRAEADDARHVERAGPQAALLAAADDQRRELGPLADEERAAALRPVHLVAGERQQIDLHRVDVDRNLAGALRRVDVKAARPRARAIAPISASGWTTPISLLAAMTLTSAVSARDARVERVEIDHARRGSTGSSVTRQPALLEPLRRFEHRLVLDRRHDDVAPAGGRQSAATPWIARLFDSVAPLVKHDLARRARR